MPTVYIFVLLTCALLLSCAGTGRHVTAWGEITLSPGDTGHCTSNPCTVYLRLPPGTGTLTVLANRIRVGDFPAGRTAMLGGFFESNVIHIEGTAAPPAYVYIPAVR